MWNWKLFHRFVFAQSYIFEVHFFREYFEVYFTLLFLVQVMTDYIETSTNDYNSLTLNHIGNHLFSRIWHTYRQLVSNCDTGNLAHEYLPTNQFESLIGLHYLFQLIKELPVTTSQERGLKAFVLFLGMVNIIVKSFLALHLFNNF